MLSIKRIKLEKRFFEFKEDVDLGHVNKNAIKPDPVRLTAVTDYPKPSYCSDVKSFLGFSSYFCRFISHFATCSAPLTCLLRKSVAWQWPSREEQCFRDLKHAFLKSPFLVHLDPSLPTFLHSDASSTGPEAVLLQEH